MIQTMDIEIVDTSDIKIDKSVIDVSEAETDEERDLLLQAGEEILTINAKTEYAVQKIVATIQGRASLEIGRVIAGVKDTWPNRRGDGLKLWYRSLGLTPTTATNYANAWRTTQDFADCLDGLVDPLKVLEASDSVLSKIQTLPSKYKESALVDIAAGDAPLFKQITNLAKQPEVKLSKAQELLEAANLRKGLYEKELEQIRANPSVKSTDSEYNAATSRISHASKAIENYKQQVLDLQAQIEEEKVKTAEETEAKKQAEAESARLETELQKLKFDDAKVRAERVKKLSTTLTVSIPQVTADVSKFFAEINCYQEEHRKHIYENAKALADKIGDCL